MTCSVPDRLRVLWLAKGLGPGGMEHLLLNHTMVGDQRRLDYHAAYLVERPNSIVPQLTEQGVRCHRLDRADPRDPRWVDDLVRLVRREAIDVVHIHSPYMAALARPALRLLRGRPRIVYTEHNGWDCYRTPTRWANAVTYSLDDAQIAVSDGVRNSLPPRRRARVETLLHGIAVDATRAHRTDREAVRSELGMARDQILVGIVANLRPAKNYPVLLAAARIAIDADPRLVFVSLGQGPLADAMAERNRELGMGDSFRFLGFRPDADAGHGRVRHLHALLRRRGSSRGGDGGKGTGAADRRDRRRRAPGGDRRGRERLARRAGSPRSSSRGTARGRHR